MEESLKHRILGISIFVIFLSFIVPLILDGNDKDDYLERTLVKNDQIENSSRRVVEIYLNDKEFELNNQSTENLNFFSQIKSKFNTITRDTLTNEIALEVNESAKEIIEKQRKKKKTKRMPLPQSASRRRNTNRGWRHVSAPLSCRTTSSQARRWRAGSARRTMAGSWARSLK